MDSIFTTNQNTSTHMYDGATNMPGEQLMYKDPILIELHVYPAEHMEECTSSRQVHVEQAVNMKPTGSSSRQEKIDGHAH